MEKAVATNPKTTEQKKLTAVHVCVNCGRLSSRNDVDGAPTPSGVFKCSLCGYEGPLHVEIRQLDE